MSVDSILPAVYDPHKKKWIFTRRYGQGTILRPLRTPKIHISAPNKHVSGSAPLRADRASQWSRYLMDDVPELAPALELLPDFIEESHIITASTEVNDPSVGRLMSVGSAATTDCEEEGIVKTLTYATGVAGSEIGIANFVDEEYILEGDDEWENTRRRLIVPGVNSHKGSATYKVTGKIKQICTVAKHIVLGVRSLIGIRTAACSTVFKQEYHPHQAQDKFLLDLLLEIPVSGTPHSDMTFSPYNPQYIGTVNERGAWVVRDITLGGKKANSIATGPELISVSQGNGWGKIQWGVDENSLIVSNRARVGLFDIRAKPPGISFIQVNNSVQRDWVLDTVSIPTNSNHSLILTSSSLIWIDSRMPGRRLLTQDHFRNTDDISLNMELFTLPSHSGGNDQATALVYSRINPLVSAFQLGYSSEIPAWLDNPYLWKMDKNIKPMAISILPAQVFGAGGDDACVSCFSISRDLVVRSQIYTSLKPSDSGDIPVHRTGLNEKNLRLVDTSNDIDVDLDEAMGNTTLEDEEGGSKLILADMSDLYKYTFLEDDSSLRTAEDGQAVEKFVCALGDRLHSECLSSGEGESKGVKTLFDIIRPSMLFDDLESLATLIERMLTGNEDVNNTVLVPRCEQFPIRSDSGRGESGQDAQGVVEGQTGRDHIQMIYQRLFDAWVAPLPPHIPTRARLRKERIARMIATEMYLASQGVMFKVKEHDSSESNGNNVREGNDIFTLWKSTNTSSLAEGQDDDNDEIFKTLQKYTTVKNVHPITLPCTSSSTSTTITPSSSSLTSKLSQTNPTTNTPTPTPEIPTTSSSTISRILEQWNISEDPDDFEYTAEGAPTTRKPRRRAGKARENLFSGGGGLDYIRGPGGSQPIQFAVSTFGGGSSTQPLPIKSTSLSSRLGLGVSSQQGVGRPAAAASSTITATTSSGATNARMSTPEMDLGAGVSMSQIERGKFGGRKPIKKKQKRKQGF